MNLTPVPDCSFQVVNAGLTEEAVHVLCVYACKAVSVHACIRLSVSVLWFETAVSSAARCRCWQPLLSTMRRTAASQACQGVSHVPVAPSSPPLLLLPASSRAHTH